MIEVAPGKPSRPGAGAAGLRGKRSRGTQDPRCAAPARVPSGRRAALDAGARATQPRTVALPRAIRASRSGGARRSMRQTGAAADISRPAGRGLGIELAATRLPRQLSTRSRAPARPPPPHPPACCPDAVAGRAKGRQHQYAARHRCRARPRDQGEATVSNRLPENVAGGRPAS